MTGSHRGVGVTEFTGLDPVFRSEHIGLRITVVDYNGVWRKHPSLPADEGEQRSVVKVLLVDPLALDFYPSLNTVAVESEGLSDDTSIVGLSVDDNPIDSDPPIVGGRRCDLAVDITLREGQPPLTCFLTFSEGPR